MESGSRRSNEDVHFSGAGVNILGVYSHLLAFSGEDTRLKNVAEELRL